MNIKKCPDRPLRLALKLSETENLRFTCFRSIQHTIKYSLVDGRLNQNLTVLIRFKRYRNSFRYMKTCSAVTEGIFPHSRSRLILPSKSHSTRNKKNGRLFLF